jgi:hypothetical protein
LVLSAVEFDAHYNAVEKSSTSITVSVNWIIIGLFKWIIVHMYTLIQSMHALIGRPVQFKISTSEWMISLIGLLHS